MTIGYHPSLTGAGADKHLQQMDMTSQQNGQPEPHLKVLSCSLPAQELEII